MGAEVRVAQQAVAGRVSGEALHHTGFYTGLLPSGAMSGWETGHPVRYGRRQKEELREPSLKLWVWVWW